MTGHKMEDASQILEESPLAFLTHYYGHTLNLAGSDMIRTERLLKDTMNTTNKLSKLNKSPLNGTQCFPDWKKNFSLEILDKSAMPYPVDSESREFQKRSW